MLGGQLRGGPSAKRQLARQHFLVNDGETVLIAVSARPSVKGFRRTIDRRQPADRREGLFEILEQSEIGNLDMVAHHQQVFGLNVQVLQPVPIVDEVERVGRVADISEKFIAGNAGESGLAAGVEAGLEAALSQFRHDDQAAVDDFDPFNRKQKRMADFLDPIERFQFALPHDSSSRP